MSPGCLHLIGTGPGGAEHLTCGGRAALRRAAEVHAIAAENASPRALEVVRPLLLPSVPVRLTSLPMDAGRAHKRRLYRELAAELGARVRRGAEVALLCLGDPLVYGSAGRLLAELDADLPLRVHPAPTAAQLAAARLRRPLVEGEEVMVWAPAGVDDARLEALLGLADVLVLLKVGRRFPDLHARLARRRLLASSWLAVELGGPAERLVRLDRIAPAPQPYMSLVLVCRREA